MSNIEAMLSSKDMSWGTPQDFFDKLNKEFRFTLDPCATEETAKCEKFYTKDDDGLSKDWSDEVVFCNPPYGREIKKWVEKCYNENKINKTKIVLLVPARTDTIYFHEYIYHKAEIRFVKGRIKFVGKQQGSGSAPFPSILVIYK